MERNWVDELKSLKKKKKEGVQIKKLIAAPCEESVVEEHLSSENVYTYILLVDDLMMK